MVDAFQKKLGTPKCMRIPTYFSYRESASQKNGGQVYVDHSEASAAFQTMVLRTSMQDPIFIPPFPNLLTQNQTKTNINTHHVRIKYWL